MTILARTLIRPVMGSRFGPSFVSPVFRAGFSTTPSRSNEKETSSPLGDFGLLNSRPKTSGAKSPLSQSKSSDASSQAATNRTLLNLLKYANTSIQDKSSKSLPKGSLRVTVSDIHRPTITPPRTGALVGRSAAVNSPELLRYAVRQVNALNRVDNVKQIVNVQRFAERPGKKRLRIRIARQRREFNDGVRRLFQLVKRAKRQGY